MSNSRTTSTLELVVDEQQLRNMSQIDLSNGQSNNQNNQQPASGDNPFDESPGFLGQLCSWPSRIGLAISSKLDQIREKSDSNLDFGLKLSQEFATIFAWSFCFLSTVIAPVIFLLAGLFNFGRCALSPALPFVVFSTGFVMTTSNLFNLALACDLPILRNQEILSDDLKNIIASIVNVLLNVIAAFLFIISGHLVYTLDYPTTDISGDGSTTSGDETTTTTPSPTTTINKESDANTCNAFLYHFTYWYITMTLIIIASLCTLALALLAYNRYRLALVRGTTVTTTNNNNANGTATTTTNMNMGFTNRIEIN